MNSIISREFRPRLRRALALALIGALALVWGATQQRGGSITNPPEPPTALALASSTSTAIVTVNASTATVTASPTHTPASIATARPTATFTIIPLPTPGPTYTRKPTPLPTETPTPVPTVDVALQVGYGEGPAASLPPYTMGPTVEPSQRYLVGGLHLGDAAVPINLAYPASFDGADVTRFDDLLILPVDHNGTNYRRFVTEYGGKVFTYPDALSGSVVLSVHDGTLRGSGRILEAEPLRRLIEGDLYAPYALDVIEANLARLMGREWVLVQNGVEARFRLIKAKRMNAADVAFFHDKAALVSAFIGGIPDPGRSLIMFFCSGRQPGEPSGTFVGRYVLLLELTE